MIDQESASNTDQPAQFPKPSRLARAIEYTKSYLEKCCAENNQESSSDKAARRTANATNWIAVFTFVTIGVGTAQYFALKRADETTRESFTAVQRPFIVPLELRITPMTDIRKKITHWLFQASIRNSGNTPAKDLVVFTTFAETPLAVDDGGLKLPDVPLIDPAVQLDRGLGTPAFVGPQVTIPIGQIGGAGIPLSHIQEIVSGKLLAYVTGAIRYKDRFKETEPHITKFCYRIGVSRDDKGILTPAYGLCRHWNCADDECDGDKARYRAELSEAYRKVGKGPEPVFMQ